MQVSKTVRGGTNCFEQWWQPPMKPAKGRLRALSLTFPDLTWEDFEPARELARDDAGTQCVRSLAAHTGSPHGLHARLRPVCWAFEEAERDGGSIVPSPR